MICTFLSVKHCDLFVYPYGWFIKWPVWFVHSYLWHLCHTVDAIAVTW